MPDPIEVHAARRLRQEAPAIAQRWVELLAARPGVPPERPLPAETLLDHIPTLLRAIADHVEDPRNPVLDDRVRRDLAVLADQRRRQGFSLAEVLAEFAILSDLVHGELADALRGFDGPPADPVAVYRLAGRVKDAIFRLEAVTAARMRAWRTRHAWERVRLVETYTSMLSHELSNRLGTAAAAVQLMTDDRTPLTDERRERLLALILNAVRSGVATVQSVRSLFEPVPANSLTPRTRPLSAVFRDVAQRATIAASERGIDFRLNGPGPEIAVDAERVPLVLLNLLSNAIEHHDRPGGRGQVSLDVVTSAGALVVSVADDGPGFDPDQPLPHVDPIAEADPSRPRGLGLAIVREAVEQLGGTLWSEPNPARGSVVSFSIPLPEQPS